MFGRFELLSKLATGGMAQVYLARERGMAGMSRHVVIKRILPHLAERPDFVEMFLREGRIIARLNHPNVVQIYDIGKEQERYFLALEYIHGVTLRELQVLMNKRGASFPLDVACGVAIKAARSLHVAHELKDPKGNSQGIVHRDVTPHNVMCTSEGHLKLLDFGIAKATEGVVEATFSGDLKGKFSYMSPEQVLQHPLDRRADIFSLGIVLWETVTGRRLFKRASQLETMQAITAGEVPSPRAYRTEIPEALDAVIMRALASERGDRWPTAEAMEQALSEVAATHGWSTDETEVKALIHEVAATRLEERQRALDEARAHHSLSEDARTHLLHNTTVDSDLLDGDSLPTVVERPSPQTHRTIEDDGGAEEEEPTAVFGDPGSDPADALGAHPVEPPRRAEPDPDPDEERTDTATQTHAAEEDSAPSSSRRFMIIAAVIIAALIGGAGVMGVMSVPPTHAHAPVTLGWAPIIDPEVLGEEVRPLHAYLSDELDREVDLVIFESYGALADKLVAGEVEYGVMPPLLYVRTKKRAPAITPLMVRKFDGSTASDGLLLVSTAVNARSLEDLRGETFCFTDTNSTTGYFLPRAHLRRNGYDPEDFIGEVHWSGDHLQVLRDLTAGKCAAGATYSGAFIAADRMGLKISQLRTLAITGHVPQDVVVAAPDLPEADQEAMKHALQGFDPKQDLDLNHLGETQRITGFVEADDAEWDDLREAIDEDAER